MLATITIITTAIIVVMTVTIMIIIIITIIFLLPLRCLFIGHFSSPSIFPPDSHVCMFLGLFSFPYSLWEISLSQILMCTTQILPSRQCCGDQSLQTSTSFSQVQLTAPHHGSLISPSCLLSWVAS